MESKKGDMKDTNSSLISCVVLYCCEQTMPETQEFKNMLNYLEYGFSEKKITEDDVYEGFFASLYVMDLMDSPKRYIVAKGIIDHLAENKLIDKAKISSKLKEALKEPDVENTVKQILS